MQLWHIALYIDSKHPQHASLCDIVNRLIPYPRSSGVPFPVDRYYCSIWNNLTDEEIKPFFFRMLDGDCKALLSFMMEPSAHRLDEAVDRQLVEVVGRLERQKQEAIVTWAEIIARREV